MKRKILLVVAACAMLAACNGTSKQPYLRIKTNATKLDYNYGENFDATGLEVELVKADGSTEAITDFTIEGGKNLRASSDVVVKAGDYSLSLNVNINEAFTGKITFVGDSLTEGHNWPKESYPNYVNSFLPDGSNVTVNNCGKNGASFKTFGQYNPAYNTTTQYQNSLKGNPDPSVITILLGTNDATNWANEADDFVQDYTDLVNLYRTTFEDAIVVMITSPKCTTNTFGIPNDTIINSVNPLQRQLAEELECPLIDLSEEIKDMPNDTLFRDGVHLTQSAAKIVAEDIADKIMEVYSE